MKVLLTLLFVFSMQIIFAQSSFLTFNGKRIDFAEIDTIGQEYITYKMADGKHKRIYKAEVFSITYPDFSAQIFYNTGDTIGDEFTADQMRSYLGGKANARQNYKNNRSVYGGFITGLIAPVVFPAIGITSVLSPLAPLTEIAFVGVGNKKSKHFPMTKEQMDDLHFKEGYLETARKKRITNSIIGSGIGLAVGITASFFIYEYHK